jgi:hypothetical protein
MRFLNFKTFKFYLKIKVEKDEILNWNFGNVVKKHQSSKLYLNHPYLKNHEICVTLLYMGQLILIIIIIIKIRIHVLFEI